VARNLDGRLEVFGIGAGTQVWHIAQQSPGGPWGTWSSINVRLRPGFIVGQNNDGRLEIFGFPVSASPQSSTATNTPVPIRAVSTLAQLTPGGAWSASTDLGGSLQAVQLVAGNTADGRIQLFAVGANGDVWSNWQTTVGASWSGWTDFAGSGLTF
jgi:hypothetical protein